jgi:N-ethylmaleimide reductase
MKTLFDSYDLAGLTLRNRIVMAPMTRARRPDYIPNADTALYYRQRAGAGLIISEGAPVSPEGQGYAFVPGLWSEAQAQGWSLVTKAVHEAGGAIFAQIWHVGRVSHTSLQEGGKAPVSATDKPARDGNTRSFAFHEDGTVGMVEVSVPRRLETDEVARVVRDFANAATHAQQAGFDGVEVHGAHGYLVEQFLNAKVNDRTDRYGGSIENRARFVLEVVDAAIERIGARRVGVRLSPFNPVHDMPAYDAAEATYLYLAAELSKRHLAYVHLSDLRPNGVPAIPEAFLRAFRGAYKGTLILAGGLDQARAEQLVRDGQIDLAAFGQPFISNPDLVERFRHGWALIQPDRATYYGGGAHGYTDYPAHAA